MSEIKTYRLYDENERKEFYHESVYDRYINTKVIKNNNGIVTVLAEYEKKKNCHLEYKEKTIADIKEMIISRESINLAGAYIKNFDITSMHLPNGYRLEGFNASYSYWDGNINFAGAKFGGEKVNFEKVNFGKGFSCFALADFGNANVNFKGTNFGKGDVNFLLANFGDGDISFRGAKFGKGRITFTRTIFGKGNIDFSEINFAKNSVNFTEANFGEGDVTFNYVNFGKGGVTFSDSTFGKGKVSFEASRFRSGYAHFIKTKFSEGEITFRSTIFDNQNIIFEYVLFNDGKIDFSSAKFGETLLSFNNSSFGIGDVDFISSQFRGGEINFEFVDFGTGKVNFDNTKFKNCDISFNNARVDSLYFFNSKFSNDVNFQFEIIKNLFLEDCVIKSLMKIEGSLEKLSLAGSANLNCIEMDWNESNIQNAIENAYLESNDIQGVERKQLYSLVAKDFLLLKENYRNYGRYEYEDAAYRCYMKYNTKSMKLFSKNFFKKPFNKLFGLISGYGTSIVRMLITCPAVMVLFSLGYIGAFRGASSMPFWKAMYFSSITFLTIGYGDISPVEMNFPKWMIALTGIEGFIGLLLMSMVTVVVVRKVLR